MHSFIVFALSFAAVGCAPLGPHPSGAAPAATNAASGSAAPPRAVEPEPGTFPDRWISGGPSRAVIEMGSTPQVQTHDHFVIFPLN